MLFVYDHLLFPIADDFPSGLSLVLSLQTRILSIWRQTMAKVVVFHHNGVFANEGLQVIGPSRFITRVHHLLGVTVLETLVERLVQVVVVGIVSVRRSQLTLFLGQCKIHEGLA